MRWRIVLRPLLSASLLRADVPCSYLVFVSRGHSPTRSSSSPALNEPNLSAQPQVPLPVQGQRVRQWVDFQAVVRVAASVAKVGAREGGHLPGWN